MYYNQGVENNNNSNQRTTGNSLLPLTRRPEYQPNRLVSPRVKTPRINSPRTTRLVQNQDSETPRAVVRSNTFVIEEGNETGGGGGGTTDHLDPLTRSVDNTAMYNVRRGAAKQRTKTPMTFNIMLDDEDSFFGVSSSPRLDTPQFATPSQPSVDYASKTSAKLIIGKQGRENSEFVWPIDVTLNTFNGQLLIADSGNHCVKIFEASGKFVKSFGKLGSQNGEMNTVSGLFMDAMSNIFVVDRLNHRK